METADVTLWRTASYSETGGGNCVEVGQAAGTIGIRDTQAREAGHLAFPLGAWEHFTATLK